MSKDIRKITFCKVSDDLLEKQVKTYVKLVSSPNFVCEKCHRLANKKKNLCNPKKIKKISA